MAPETEKSKMRKFPMILGSAIAVCVALAVVDASATAVLDGPGVSLSVQLPDGKLCDKSESVTIRIDNALGETIEIGSLSTSRHRLREEKNELNGAVKQVSESLPGAVLESTIAAEVEKEMTIDASFPIPAEDGPYSDVFTLKWRRVGSDAWLYTDAFIKLDVTDGCAEVISDLEYEALTNVYSLIRHMKDGKEVVELAVEGGGTFDGYETPWAEIDDGVAPISTDSEKAVIIDGTPYQFIDPSYDLSSDDTLDDDFSSAEGGGGMALDSVLSLHYCVKVQYHQDAYQQPEDWTGMRWWHPMARIEPGDIFTAMNFLGLVVELYDRDDDSRDEYITSALLNYTANGQYFCINFNWDQVAQGETYPDPYISTHYEVRGSTVPPSTKHGHLCTDSCEECADHPFVSWRNQYTTNLGFGISSVSVSRYFTPDSTPSADEVEETSSSQAIQMAYLQKFFQIWGGYEMTDDIHALWYENALLVTNYKDCIHLARKYTTTDSDIYWHRRWDGPVHEAGHAYKRQVWGESMNYNPDCGSDDHYGYCSYSYQCAHNEGWAEFVAMRSWYPDDTDVSEPVYYSTTASYEVEPGGYDLWHSPFSEEYCGSDRCLPTSYGSTYWHQCYARNEMMGMRAYWDMMDNNPDALDLASNTVGWESLVDIWELYEYGFDNHESEEPGTNMIDYLFHSSEISSDTHDDIESAMENNSMTWQED
jgi:hypothetical protein